jgi:hypothetical protein
MKSLIESMVVPEGGLAGRGTAAFMTRFSWTTGRQIAWAPVLA